MPAQFPLKLVSGRMLAPSVRHLVFVRDDGLPLDFMPGQFVQVHFANPDGSASKRSYSLASQHPGTRTPQDDVEIAVSYVAGGTATALFEHLHEGETLQASGPYGRFCLMPTDTNARYLLVATGTGVTPYRSMLPQIAQLIAQRGIEVVLLQGARSPEELLYGDDFEAFARTHANFRYIPCFSRLVPADAHADVRQGYVQGALPELMPDAARDIAYLCGNPDMVDACFEALKTAGLPIPHIRREKYVSSK